MTQTTTSALKFEIEYANRYQVSVEEYIAFRKNGFLVVSGLVSSEDVAELRQHTEDLMQGKLPEQQARIPERDLALAKDAGITVQSLEAPPAHLSPDEKAQYFLRIHMLHRKLELHERYMLHPRVLDVVECLIGPDVLAMQTMLFLKPPGKPGQGWHQDTFYIPTHPDTLCGAWIAVDDCDEQNGAMWFAKSSNAEPVYPPEADHGHGDRDLHDVSFVAGVSNPVDEENDLARVADKYDQVLVSAKAGDVVFFGGHVLHRSKQNWSEDRYRRAFVSHYCHARSFTQWGGDLDISISEGAVEPIEPVTRLSNGSHILARGDSHLPFAKPRFGTPCAALLTPEERKRPGEFARSAMADMASGEMGVAPADPNQEDDHDASAVSSGGY